VKKSGFFSTNGTGLVIKRINPITPIITPKYVCAQIKKAETMVSAFLYKIKKMVLFLEVATAILFFLDTGLLPAPVRR